MIALTDAAQERAAIERQERTERLARSAGHFTTERDTITGGWIVRNPRIPGRCELVTPDGRCTCRHFRLWDRCKHAAAVALRYGIDR